MRIDAQEVYTPQEAAELLKIPVPVALKALPFYEFSPRCKRISHGKLIEFIDSPEKQPPEPTGQTSRNEHKSAPSQVKRAQAARVARKGRGQTLQDVLPKYDGDRAK